MNGWRQPARMALMLGLTAILVLLFIGKANLSEVTRAISGAHLGWIGAALVSSSAAYLLRAWRWQFLLAPTGRVRYRSAVQATAIGFAASFLLPGRAGDVLRPYLLARSERLSVVPAIATIAVERLVDMVAVLILFAGFAAWPGTVGHGSAMLHTMTTAAAAAAAASLGALVVLVVVARRPDLVETMAASIGRWIPSRILAAGLGIYRQLTPGIGVLSKPATAIVALAGALPLWLCSVATIWCVSNALALGITFPQAGVMLMLLVVGVAVPTPGGVGSFHYAFRLGATTLFAVRTADAIAAAIVLHAVTFFPVTIAGVAIAAATGLNRGTIRTVMASVPRASNDPPSPVIVPVNSPVGSP